MIQKAIDFANKAHSKQVRKGSDIPYIFHPVNVGKILAERLGCSADIVIAGILHDTLEDTQTQENEILDYFGENVLRLVKGNSERDKSDTWENRKKEALKKAETESEDVLLIKLADKYDNLKAIEIDFLQHGDKVWERFNAPKDRLAWYYSSLGKIFEDKLKSVRTEQIMKEYNSALNQVFG